MHLGRAEQEAVAIIVTRLTIKRALGKVENPDRVKMDLRTTPSLVKTELS
ncbi:MAG: hypothetical protein GTN65_11430 [Armatimonadetes bacterium]|nr:hypothetical protein [Armatimonadota bacterium]NIO97678.1 hypothetical protein [Armatimonadota bacterium]